MSEVDVADSRRSWRVLGFVLGSVAVVVALATPVLGSQVLPVRVLGGLGWLVLVVVGALVVLFFAADVAVRTAVPEGLAAAAVGILTLLATAAAALVLGIAALVGWAAERRRPAPRPAQ